MDFNDRRPAGRHFAKTKPPTRPTFFDPQPYFTKSGVGKLFKDPKPVDAVRWPRGYTPKRQAEVVDAQAEENFTLNPAETKGEAFAGPAGKRRMQDAIARSGTPAAEMRDTNISMKPVDQLPQNAYGVYYNPYTRTSLSRRDYAFDKAVSNIDISSNSHEDTRTMQEREWHAGNTMLHELGHHKSYEEGRDSSNYNTPARRGAEEAFADDNAASRFRPDPRDVRARKKAGLPEITQIGSAYENPATWSTQDGYNAYVKARKTPMKIDQQKAQREQMLENYHDRGYQPKLPFEAPSVSTPTSGTPTSGTPTSRTLNPDQFRIAQDW